MLNHVTFKLTIPIPLNNDVSSTSNCENGICVTVQYVIVDISEKSEWHHPENKGNEREHSVN